MHWYADVSFSSGLIDAPVQREAGISEGMERASRSSVVKGLPDYGQSSIGDQELR